MSVIEIKATVPRVEIIPVVIGGLAPWRRRLTMAVGFAALLAWQLLLAGGMEVFALHLIGLGICALLLRRIMSRHKVTRHKH